MSINRSFLTVSLLVPLALASAAANAGSTISDKSYWPNEARRATTSERVTSPRDLNSAFAYDQPATWLRPRSAWRYQGGPKSH